jgi:hypothetical protein
MQTIRPSIAIVTTMFLIRTLKQRQMARTCQVALSRIIQAR